MSAKPPVVEVVTYRIDIGRDAFLAAIPPTMEFLRTCPGFLGRQLGENADGAWVDLVQWASMAEALAAAARFNHSPLTAAFNAAIAPGTTVMRHYTIAAGG
jgi:hypothetical protein